MVHVYEMVLQAWTRWEKKSSDLLFLKFYFRVVSNQVLSSFGTGKKQVLLQCVGLMITNSGVALDVSSASPVSVSGLAGFNCLQLLARGCPLLIPYFPEKTCSNMLSFRDTFSLTLLSLVNSDRRSLTFEKNVS